MKRNPTGDADRRALPSLFMLVLTVAIYLAAGSSASAGAGPEITLLTQTQSSTTSGTGQHTTQVGDSSANSTVIGHELSRTQCGRRAGRDSSASAHATVTENRREGALVTWAMSASAEAKGGHYRSCGGCVLGQCVDISGNDTTASATARAQATAEVRFPKEAAVGDYVVSVLVATDAGQQAPAWALAGVKSTELPDQTEGVRRFLVQAGPETFFRVDFASATSASNPGGCCSETLQSNSTITLGVQNAGLLESMTTRYGLRMVNGNLETGFHNVGLLALYNPVSNKPEAHCSGTLTTRSTVLTAAHCVAGLFGNTLRFMLGSDIRDPNSKWFDVDGWRYPQGGVDDTGLQYSANSYVDDVAVVYLKTAVPENIPLFELHQGLPALREVVDRRAQLTFVGFGQFEAGPGGRGAGVKRRLLLGLKDLDLRTYTNIGQGANTCKGDSGGPSFAEAPQQVPLLAGVVSRGDDACLYDGINSRVEHYYQWIKSHEK